MGRFSMERYDVSSCSGRHCSPYACCILRSNRFDNFTIFGMSSPYEVWSAFVSSALPCRPAQFPNFPSSRCWTSSAAKRCRSRKRASRITTSPIRECDVHFRSPPRNALRSVLKLPLSFASACTHVRLVRYPFARIPPISSLVANLSSYQVFTPLKGAQIATGAAAVRLPRSALLARFCSRLKHGEPGC